MAKKSAKDILTVRKFIVTGVGTTLHTETKNICAHIGCSMADFLKTKIADVVHTYPAHYKTPMIDDETT